MCVADTGLCRNLAHPQQEAEHALNLEVAMFYCLNNIITFVSKYIYAVLSDEYNQQKKTPMILFLEHGLETSRHQ